MTNFRERAKQQQKMQDRRTSLQKLATLDYVNNIKKFAKTLASDKQALENFEQEVLRYAKDTQNTNEKYVEKSSLSGYKKLYGGLKNPLTQLYITNEMADAFSKGSKYQKNIVKGENVSVYRADTSTIKNKEKRLNTQYVMYWVSRMITEQNINVDKALSLVNENKTELIKSLEYRKLDVERFNSYNRKVDVVTPEQFIDRIKNIDFLMTKIESKESSYNITPKQEANERLRKKILRIDKIDKDKLDKDKGGSDTTKLSFYKNLKLLALDNMMYAMHRASWDKATELLNYAILNGKVSMNDLYDAYFKDMDVGIVFTYENTEKIDDSDKTAEEELISNVLAKWNGDITKDDYDRFNNYPDIQDLMKEAGYKESK